MLTSLSKLLLLCALVSYCAGEELVQSQGPFKPVSPVPLNPQISQIMNALQSNQMPFNPFASSMAMKMMMMGGSGDSDSVSHMKISDMPEITRTMCSCESSLEAEQCLAGAAQKKIENFEEIKTITKKLQSMLNKHVFKSVIVKRSVEQLEQTVEQALVANGKDAKHDIELMLNIYENIKQMLQLSSEKDVEAFKAKLMGMPEKQMTLRELIDELKSGKSQETCEHEKQTVECTPGTQLKIIKAAITNKNKYACPAMARKLPLKAAQSESCYEEEMTTKLMNATCGGKQECTVSVHRDFLNICKCAEQKYLELTYTCEAATPEDAQNHLSRSKRTLHYRNKPKQEQRDKLMRSGGLFGGLYDYGLYGYGYGLPYDYYGLYGYGYGLPFYDYYGYGYGYGYGMPFVGAFTYDYDNGGYGQNLSGKGGYASGSGSAEETAQ